MPEMPAVAKRLVTSRPYVLIASRVLLPWVLQGERPAGEGVEIGAGSGAMTAQLLNTFPGLRMVATDYDADMIATAQRALARFGNRASAQRADAADLPFEDGRFDLVLSAAMPHHVVAWATALAEAIRVLRPGGHLVGYDLLEAAPIRLLAVGHGDHIRMLRVGQLEAELAKLRVTDIRVRRSVGGLAARFAATKAA
jgi:SAM-dependent methyltransferase